MPRPPRRTDSAASQASGDGTSSSVSSPRTPGTARSDDSKASDAAPRSDAASPALAFRPTSRGKRAENDHDRDASPHGLKDGKPECTRRSDHTSPAKAASESRKSDKSRHEQGRREAKQGGERGRTPDQTLARLLALYIVPILFAVPLSLVLALTRTILNPLYNSIPLTLHPRSIYFPRLLLPTLAYWKLTSGASAPSIISARVCVGVSALSADLVAVAGRRVGSFFGESLGPQGGAAASLASLAIGVIGGGLCFALLCFDHAWPMTSISSPSKNGPRLAALLIRGLIYLVHIYHLEKLWRWALPTHLSFLLHRPEKTILFISLILTIMSFLLRSSGSDETFSQRVQRYYKNRKDLPAASRKQFVNLASRLPSDLYPILILLRLPLLVLVLRQQLYLHPVPPYTIEDGTLRILHSEQSLTGQIVIADNLRDGYRFMRCDHSILGGRWTREVSDGKGGTQTDMGDSIFGCFPLQEIGTLAHRSDPSDAITETISLTTELEMDLAGRPDEPENRALIIGLGVGIAAASFARKGYEVDIVEIDPAVYTTAAEYFNLSQSAIASVNLMSGSTYIRHLANESRAYNATRSEDVATAPDLPKWNLVVQDCFSGGSVPGEMFTREFWLDLTELVERDGIVAMNFVGLKGSRASRAVLVTLLSVFEQCRAFSDSTESEARHDQITNMVVFCTVRLVGPRGPAFDEMILMGQMTHSPLLTFRSPTADDVMRSPLRSHVYTTFHKNEIHLDDIVQVSDWENPEMMLTETNSNLDRWQVDTALATWRAMRNILTPAMWLAW